jgi:hypothetical protein
MDNNTRIIRLSPNTYISRVSSFEEVFDEYSEARGGKAKRIAKRVERQKAKTELQKAKGETKAARVQKRATTQAARQEKKAIASQNRQAKKTDKSAARQDRRSANVMARQQRMSDRSLMAQDRRTNRRASVLNRRNMGQEFEPEVEEIDENEIVDEGGYTEEEYVPQGGGVLGGEEYEDDGLGGSYEESFNENFGSEQYDQNEYGDDGYDFGDEYDSYQNDEPEFDYNFEGNTDSQTDNELVDDEQADQIIKIPEAITVLADKIEWNNELYSRLDGEKKAILSKNPNANVKVYDETIEKTKNRVGELENLLNGWADCKYNYTSNNQFEDFPNLDIDFSSADGKNKLAKVKKGRNKRVKKARANARKKREKITTVKTTLNPIIESNRIVVPPTSNFDGIPKGTGIIGLDNDNDFDAPNNLEFELTSNASGLFVKDNTNAILIGVGVALLGIWAINKYKLIK